eukprot:1187164-Prorocentrum_minimum.AAC.4
MRPPPLPHVPCRGHPSPTYSPPQTSPGGCPARPVRVTPQLGGYPSQRPPVLAMQLPPPMLALQLCECQYPVPSRSDKVLIIKETYLPHCRHVSGVRNQPTVLYVWRSLPSFHAVRPG